MSKEYDSYGDVTITFSTDSLGKLKESIIKKLMMKTLEDYFEKEDNVSEYDVSEPEMDVEYEELE